MKGNLMYANIGSIGGFCLLAANNFGLGFKDVSGSCLSWPISCSLINAASSIEFAKTPIWSNGRETCNTKCREINPLVGL